MAFFTSQSKHLLVIFLMAMTSVIGTTVSATSQPSFYEIYFGKDAAFMTYQNVKAEHQTAHHGIDLDIDMATDYGNYNYSWNTFFGNTFTEKDCTQHHGHIVSDTTTTEETCSSLSSKFTMSEYIF